MNEILEAIMLICFGLSWPLSVIKNIRAHTAKSMSLPFILLITFGYVAGISAKLITGNYSYVLIIYAVNLIAVLLNVVIYFVNRNYDLHAAQFENQQRATVNCSNNT